MIGLMGPAQVRTAYRAEMRAARMATGSELRRRRLERAHILSQPWPWPHTRNHVAMFALTVRQRDRREAFGQVLRIIVAARWAAIPRATTASRDLRLITDRDSADLKDLNLEQALVGWELGCPGRRHRGMLAPSERVSRA
ncbi:DUF3703 domain-containing protein [Nonomuraea sp. CA-141351]|uniref:DUF3703 domain-containing protein n=1 Tax=Nonomuraea sp. CA-141351 TaxID=3239996 RepID=UPI003D8FAA21